MNNFSGYFVDAFLYFWKSTNLFLFLLFFLCTAISTTLFVSFIEWLEKSMFPNYTLYFFSWLGCFVIGAGSIVLLIYSLSVRR